MYECSKNLSITTTMILHTLVLHFLQRNVELTSCYYIHLCSTFYSVMLNCHLLTPFDVVQTEAKTRTWPTNCTTNTQMFSVHSCFLQNWQHQVIIPSNSLCSLHHMSNQTEMLLEWVASPWGGLEHMRILPNISPKFLIMRCNDDKIFYPVPNPSNGGVFYHMVTFTSSPIPQKRKSLPIHQLQNQSQKHSSYGSS